MTEWSSKEVDAWEDGVVRGLILHVYTNDLPVWIIRLSVVRAGRVEEILEPKDVVESLSICQWSSSGCID